MIECTRFKPFKDGTLLGFADLYITKWDADIPGFKLHQKDGKRWVQIPSLEYMKDGEKKYAPLIKFREKENWEAFITQAKAAIDRYCESAEQKPEHSGEACPF